MPLYPPAPIVRTATTSFRQSIADPQFDTTTVRYSDYSRQPPVLVSQATVLLTAFVTSAVNVLAWGAMLHIAMSATSGKASLQAALDQYATVLRWLLTA